MSIIKKNSVEVESAKDRVRASNIDGIFREEVEEPDDAIPSSSSSSF
jgi:hypothetical protein